jgi:TolA-binding protein
MGTQKNVRRGGFVRQVLIMFMLAVVFSILACSGNSGKELFETAKFEELQNNKEHATEMYEEVIKKYPKSEYAKKAEERLNVLKRNK